MLHLQALAGGPLIQARNFAVMTGTNAGIACIMKRLRGKEDVQSRLTFSAFPLLTFFFRQESFFMSSCSP
jgi:hypothetical protein